MPKRLFVLLLLLSSLAYSQSSNGNQGGRGGGTGSGTVSPCLANSFGQYLTSGTTIGCSPRLTESNQTLNYTGTNGGQFTMLTIGGTSSGSGTWTTFCGTINDSGTPNAIDIAAPAACSHYWMGFPSGAPATPNSALVAQSINGDQVNLGWLSGLGINELDILNNGTFYGSILSGQTGSMNFTNCTASGTAPNFNIACSGSGGMVYPGAGVPNSTGTAWGTSYQVGTAASNLVQLDGSGNLPGVGGAALTGLTKAQVGLGSVTNDVQTKAAIVPNTAPPAGEILIGNAGGTAYAPNAMSGDCGLSSAGAINCTKTNGAAFGALATLASGAIPAGYTIPYSQVSGTPSALPPNGAAGGDLNGNYPNPGVGQVNGAAVPASMTVAGTNSSHQFIDNSAAQLANNTTGWAAIFKSWTSDPTSPAT